MEILENPERAVEVGKILLNTFKNEGIFGHNTMPEAGLPKNMIKGSSEHANYITLLVALDYMREAGQLWQAGLDAYSDESTRWIFDVFNDKIKDFGILKEALYKYKVSKKHTRDTKIWQTLALSIRKLFNGGIVNFLNGCNKDAKIAYYSMKTKYKQDFPNLTGNKILPLWLRMMNDVVCIELKNLDGIELPVDVHVARATFTTGCLEGRNIKSDIQKIYRLVDSVWGKASTLSGTRKLDFDEPLWTLSKHGCNKMKDKYCPMLNQCPVKDYCIAVKKKIKVVQGKEGVVLE